MATCAQPRVGDVDEQRPTIVVAAVATTLGLFVLMVAATSLEQAFVAAVAIGLAFALGFPLFELRRGAGPGEAHFQLVPFPRVNVRGILTTSGIVTVSIGWLLVGGVLATVIAELLAGSPLEPDALGLLALVATIGTLVLGTRLTWEWCRKRLAGSPLVPCVP
jgi:hypothetical protein